jgi:xylan 1,4-beta-xylosidase
MPPTRRSRFAAQTTASVLVLVWHYHDDDVAGPDAEVRLNLTAPSGV